MAIKTVVPATNHVHAEACGPNDVEVDDLYEPNRANHAARCPSLEMYNELVKRMDDWVVTSSDCTSVEDVVNSMQGLLLDVLTSGMTVIANNASRDDVWRRAELLKRLIAWSDENIAKLSDICDF